MGQIGCSETSVRNYHYSLSNNPEGRSSQLLRGGSLKSRTASLYLGRKLYCKLSITKWKHCCRKRILNLET